MGCSPHKVQSCISFALVLLTTWLSYDLEFDFPLKGGIKVMATLDYFYNVARNTDLSSCAMCKIPAAYKKFKPNSSQRDVIFMYSIGRLKSLVPFARAIRSVGSKCRVIVFTDEAALHNYQKEFYDAILNCGIEFINMGNIKLPGHNSIYYHKYVVMSDYLRFHQNDFDRCIYADMFDSAVQADPFNEGFTPEKMYFCDEGYIINTCNTNKHFTWGGHHGLKKYFPGYTLKDSDMTEIQKGTIINGGSFYGGASVFQKFNDEMCKIGNRRTLQIEGIDQGHLNVLIHMGYFKDKFPYVIDSVGNEVIVSICKWAEITRLTESKTNTSLGTIWRDGVSPGILHQIDRCRSCIDHLKEQCPNTNPTLPDYFR